MKEEIITSPRYLFEGRYWTVSRLVEEYGKANGVTVATFKKRIQNPERWTIASALLTPPKTQNRGPGHGMIRDEIQVTFPRFISGIYWHMQPLLNTVYDAQHVKLQAAKSSKFNSSGTDEYVIVTLENGKKLLAYRGEYSVVSTCSD